MLLWFEVSQVAVIVERCSFVPCATHSSRLMIEGKKMQPVTLQDVTESSPLYEEVIAMDGILEEFFAFDNM